MLTIITPCCRQANLKYLHASIDFDKIDKWIIVYDTSKDRSYTKLYKNTPKILEVECNIVGAAGHPQRNFGMLFVNDGYIYFLDDDNIIHPNFWTIAQAADNEKFYTFSQLRDKKKGSVLDGNTIKVGSIDTAMFLFHKRHVGSIRWIENLYEADGYFICAIDAANKGSHVFINSIACYYNYLV